MSFFCLAIKTILYSFKLLIFTKTEDSPLKNLANQPFLFKRNNGEDSIMEEQNQESYDTLQKVKKFFVT